MDEKNTLHVLWTTGDPHTSQFMVLMYAKNSMLREWWKNVTVIVWGASAKLVAENTVIQEEIKIAQHAGVKFTACIACARQLGVVDQLEALGIEVVSWGPLLTEVLKENEKLITI
ncbi:MAG: DsrE family protein [Clostridia bacterium]|jgi:hypothetical protein|nr:DsrE family protein [Clostridia bacterium]